MCQQEICAGRESLLHADTGGDIIGVVQLLSQIVGASLGPPRGQCILNEQNQVDQRCTAKIGIAKDAEGVHVSRQLFLECPGCIARRRFEMIPGRKVRGLVG